ncbi:type III secretion system protein SepQ [Salmonella enterica]|uniref:type III secretion system protein SepQ n=1 Tax=Salmonella enterica TaxID=28901 RepID=UPI001C441EA6|nr:type III secretion system protein SepQ [Salmonella enterica]
MKLNKHFFPLLSCIGSGKRLLLEDELILHTFFRSFSGNGVRVKIIFSGQECTLFLPETQLIQWCIDLFPYGDCRAIGDDILKLMLLWSLKNFFTGYELLIKDIYFITLEPDVYPVVELSQNDKILNLVFLDVAKELLSLVIDDQWERASRKSVVTFDGTIVIGWSDYQVSQLNVGEALKIYYVDDTNRNSCWLTINNPVAQVQLNGDSLYFSHVYEQGLLAMIESDSEKNRIYCVIGTISLNLNLLEEASTGMPVAFDKYNLWGRYRLIRNNEYLASGSIIKINDDFYFIVKSVH